VDAKVRPAAPGPARAPGAFWSAFWLALTLLAAKAFYLSFRAPGPPSGVAGYLAALAAISHRDLGFALGVGFLHHFSLRATAASPAVRRGLHATFGGISWICAVYGLVNVEAFSHFLTPLTYPLLALSGSFRTVLATVAVHMTLPFAASIVVLAVAPRRLCALSERLGRSLEPRSLRALEALGIVAVLGWIDWGEHRFAAGWSHRIDRRIAENAHWRLVASTATALGGDSPFGLVEPVVADDLADFATVAEQKPVARKVALGRSAPPLLPKLENVVVVVLESVSARSLEIYGSPYPATPHLSAEARHALVFDDFYCHVGRSSDSLAAMLLALHPRVGWRDATTAEPLPDGVTLPDLLRERGYRTTFLTPSDLGWASWRGFLEGRGFDSVRDQSDLGCTPLTTWGGGDGCAIEALVRFVAEDSAAPFFAMVWTVQTHHPYEPSPERPFIDFFDEPEPPDAYDFGRYLNVLSETDAHLGRLFDELRARGLDRDTLVVVVGDHGEAFGQPHGSYGHGTALYEENVRVPLLLWSPRLFPKGGRSATIGSHVDLIETIADLIGVAPDGAWQGRSLFDRDRPPRAYFFVARDDFLIGVREGPWKYVLDVTNGRDELYDLRKDPNERTNLAAVEPDRAKRLRQRLAARVEAGQTPSRPVTTAAGL
jgi:arylsulfatase A-like enzyme